MSKVVLAVCDSNKVYCQRMQEYLRGHLKLSFVICVFSDPEKLMEFSRQQKIGLLVISESAYRSIPDSEYNKEFKNVIILEEDLCDSEAERSYTAFENLRVISKYSPASMIVDTVLELCMSSGEEFSGLSGISERKSCKIIGFFTPISRCGQTSLAIKMGESIAKEKKTIMISFESFSALSSMFDTESEEDITDLLYYADCEREKFCLYLEKIKKTRNGLDYINPARTAMQVKEIGFGKLKGLIELLTKKAGYEYILLDLKEYPDGFFEILNMCDVLYTITRNNSADHYRIGKYNRVLGDNGYEEVLTKTIRFNLPEVREGASYNRYVEALFLEGREVASLGA